MIMHEQYAAMEKLKRWDRIYNFIIFMQASPDVSFVMNSETSETIVRSGVFKKLSSGLQLIYGENNIG